MTDGRSAATDHGGCSLPKDAVSSAVSGPASSAGAGGGLQVGCTHPGAPPSAAGSLEPYGAQIFLASFPAEFSVESFLRELLERVAADCATRGASVIGHLKCLFRGEGVLVRCNLTSLRQGANCVEAVLPPAAGSAETSLEAVSAMKAQLGADATSDASTVAAAGSSGGTLDLTVLVYDVPARVVDQSVIEALGALLVPAGVRWGKRTLFSPSGRG